MLLGTCMVGACIYLSLPCVVLFEYHAVHGVKRRGKIIKKLSHTHAQSHKAKEMCVTIFFVADTLTNTLSDDA